MCVTRTRIALKQGDECKLHVSETNQVYEYMPIQNACLAARRRCTTLFKTRVGRLKALSQGLCVCNVGWSVLTSTYLLAAKHLWF